MLRRGKLDFKDLDLVRSMLILLIWWRKWKEKRSAASGRMWIFLPGGNQPMKKKKKKRSCLNTDLKWNLPHPFSWTKVFIFSADRPLFVRKPKGSKAFTMLTYLFKTNSFKHNKDAGGGYPRCLSIQVFTSGVSDAKDKSTSLRRTP